MNLVKLRKRLIKACDELGRQEVIYKLKIDPSHLSRIYCNPITWKMQKGTEKKLDEGLNGVGY